MLRGEDMDFSRYELGFVEAYRHFQECQLSDWLLYVIAEEGGVTRPVVLAYCRETLDAQDVPILRELGWGKELGLEKQVLGVLGTLIERGLITAGGGVLDVTEKGRAELGPGVQSVEQVPTPNLLASLWVRLRA